MTIDLTDTTTGAIHDALRQARLRLGGVASGMVLTLVIVTDEGEQYDAVRAASAASRQHPCRILVVIIRRPEQRSRLDAEIRVGETSPGETVLLRMYGPLGQHADSVVAPLLLPDTPVVTWWPGTVPPIPAQDPMGALAQRRITDCAAVSSPRDALAKLAAGYQPGDTDLDPGDAVAVAPGSHDGPAVRGGHRRHGQRRGRQPERRPDRGLAVARVRDRGRQRAVRRAGHHRGHDRDQRR
jgi:glucose-6-phosphate dehydrogenase assembly protein OpcA